MYSNKLYTPLRYPGGKAQFAPFIARLMEENGLAGGHYLEPYAGGAGVALELLFHGHAEHIHINDLDPAVHAFWVAVTQESDALLDLLHQTPVDMEQWFRWRSVLRGESTGTVVERGFATLFLNRTNRSGILKGGVIGGLAQSGTYKLDARFKKDVLAARIKKIAQHADHITVHCEDALALLSRATRLLPVRSLVYLDPPYFVKGRGLYRNYYEHQDHLAIARLLQSRQFRRPWLVSYDNVNEIRQMYELSRGLSYGLSYTAQQRYIGSEVMFFSQRLSVPDGAIPQSQLVA
ncbi:DNA adenine methylase [Pelomonas sp. Root1217]|uniref:DNA adenine methylase n=1 Tax=Pelomonas sp. Root1217 TaxID=1736430 RepID=UPI0009E86C8B|nr:DNA adenine methylase [Pelomonas sp. Root1217]